MRRVTLLLRTGSVRLKDMVDNPDIKAENRAFDRFPATVAGWLGVAKNLPDRRPT